MEYPHTHICSDLLSHILANTQIYTHIGYSYTHKWARTHTRIHSDTHTHINTNDCVITELTLKMLNYSNNTKIMHLFFLRSLYLYCILFIFLFSFSVGATFPSGACRYIALCSTSWGW